MKHYTAVSLSTKSPPVQAAPQKKVAISEDGLAMLMALDALNSAVMRGSTRKPKADGNSGPKIVSEKLMEKVLRIIKRAGRTLTTQEITRKAKVAPDSTRIAAASGHKTHVVSPRLVRLRNAGYVEMHSRFNVRTWARTGIEPPAHKPERQEIGGVPVMRVKSGGIRVTLPAMPEGLAI